jgi:hypothetical protein
MRKWTALATFAWLAVYAPLETYVTLDVAGVAGLVMLGYVMNVVGMGLMLKGGLATWREEARGPAWLVIGWCWTTATFWRATSDRFWWHSVGNQLYAGDRELWLAPAMSTLATGFLLASIVLLFRQVDR